MDEIKIDKIIRSKRKTISLSVTPEAALVVRAPRRVSPEYIKNLIFKKRFWILKKKKQVLDRGPSRAKEFIEGEEFFYLGRKYALKISETGEIGFTDHLSFPAKYLSRARRKMVLWYMERTREIVFERVRHYSEITDWKLNSISVTRALKRWGSCSFKNTLNFSFKLAMVPPEVIDYIVVHELAHIPEKNHSANFWNKVEAVLPDYRARRKWLRENEGILKI